MTLHRLEIMLSVAKYRSFSKAANEHHISQPAVSLHIRLLEEECGVKLHKKNGQGVELTEAGRKFIDYAKEILSLVENIKKDLGGTLSAAKTGSLRIGGSESPSVSFLPSVIGAFTKTRPVIRLFFETEVSDVLEEMVLNSEVDIALITNPSHSAALVYEPILQESVLAVVSSRHPLAEKKELSLAELAKESLVIKRGKTGPSTAEKFIKEVGIRGYELNANVLCDTGEAVKTVVKKGLGIGILHSDIAEPDIRRGELKVIKVPGLNRKIETFLIYHKERTLSPIAKNFLTFLHKWPRKTHRTRATARVIPLLKQARGGPRGR